MWARLQNVASRFYGQLRGSRLSATGIALSVAVGLGVGLIPLYGMHWALVLVVCWPLRLDSALAFAATMISNPVTLPFLVALELHLGASLVGAAALEPERLLAGHGWSEAALQLAVGTAVLSTVVATVGACVVWTAVRRFRRLALQRANNVG